MVQYLTKTFTRWIPGLAELVKGRTEEGLRSLKTVLDSMEQQQGESGTFLFVQIELSVRIRRYKPFPFLSVPGEVRAGVIRVLCNIAFGES
jgi:hypothetical protein